MKKANFVKLGALLGSLLLVGIIPLVAGAQEDTTIATDTLYCYPVGDGIIWYSDTLNVVTGISRYIAGDWKLITSAEEFARSYLSFELCPLPDSITIIEATLSVYQCDYVGNNSSHHYPIWDVPGGDTLFCIMDHINYGAYLDTSDWGAGDPGNLKTLTSNIGVLSDDATIEYKSLDVTRYVQADIDAKRKRSQFRIRFPIDTDHDGRTDAVLFSSSSAPRLPYMTVRYNRHNAVEEWGDHNFPGEFRLEQNFPNPFNVATTIRYHLPAVSDQQLAISNQQSVISLKIYNILGQEVRMLVDERQTPGYYSVLWDGKDDQGKDLVSGVYFGKLEYGGFIAVRKLVLLR